MSRRHFSHIDFPTPFLLHKDIERMTAALKKFIYKKS